MGASSELLLGAVLLLPLLSRAGGTAPRRPQAPFLLVLLTRAGGGSAHARMPGPLWLAAEPLAGAGSKAPGGSLSFVRRRLTLPRLRVSEDRLAHQSH